MCVTLKDARRVSTSPRNVWSLSVYSILGIPIKLKCCLRAEAAASEDLDFKGINVVYKEYRSEIMRACVYPFELFGKYSISALMASLGWVGTIVLFCPTGTFLYSGFFVNAHVTHALQIFCTILRALGWK